MKLFRLRSGRPADVPARMLAPVPFQPLQEAARARIEAERLSQAEAEERFAAQQVASAAACYLLSVVPSDRALHGWGPRAGEGAP